MDGQPRTLDADWQTLALALQNLNMPLQVLLAEGGLPALSAGPACLYASAWREDAAPALDQSSANALCRMDFQQLLAEAVKVGAGVLLDQATLLSPALVARLERSRLLQHDGRRWLLEFCPHWSGRELRDLLALRSERELPPLQVWRAVCLDAPELAVQPWLVVEQALRTGQLESCQAHGYRCWTRAMLGQQQPAFGTWAASRPLTRMSASRRSAAPALIVAVMVCVTLLVGGLVWKAGDDRAQRIQQQRVNAASALFDAPRRGYLDPLYEALIRIGVPAAAGGRVVDLPPPAGLELAAQGEALRAVLGFELADRLPSFAALESYQQEQAQRIGQRRMILSAEYCQYRFSVVIPLLANRSFVLTVEEQPGQAMLRWSGIEHIDPAELGACAALGLPRL